MTLLLAEKSLTSVWCYREAKTESDASKAAPEPSADDILGDIEDAVAEAVEASAEAAVDAAKEAAAAPTSIAHIVARDPGQASSVDAEAGSSFGGPEAIQELQAMESIAGSEAASLAEGREAWPKGASSSQPTHIWQRR